MSFATKLCHVVYAGGAAQDVMKHPATDQGKISLPGGWVGGPLAVAGGPEGCAVLCCAELSAIVLIPRACPVT
jgi:hypothetical protein